MIGPTVDVNEEGWLLDRRGYEHMITMNLFRGL